MASASHPLSLRLGADGQRALADIARKRGITRAEAARQAIAETAERERRRAGREQHGPRYAVLVQADELLGLSTVLVAPTSRSALPASFRPEVEVAAERTRVMVEQMRALDAERLDDFAGRLSAEEMREVDDALSLTLALR